MDYSDKQFNTMQQEAIRRVREMQKRSRTAVEGEEVTGEENNQEKSEDETPLPQKTKGGNITNPAALFNLGGVKIDEEKALIGLLIYILYKQNADIKLLLGLGYLLL